MKFNLKKIIIFLQSLTIVFAPLYIIRFYIPINFLGDFVYPTTFLEILITFTVLVTAVDLIKTKYDLRNLRTNYDFLILLLLLACFIATLRSYSLLGGLGILKAYFLEPILFFYSIIYIFKTKNTYKHIIASLFIASLWLSLLSLLQKLTGQYSLAPYELSLGRVSAVYNSANSLALFISPIIIFTLAYMLLVKSFSKKVLFGLFYLFQLMILLWTRSRGGLVSIILAIATFAYLILISRSNSLKKYWYLIPSLVLLVTTISGVIYYQKHNFLPTFYNQPYTLGDTIQIRYFIWGGTINMLKDHPILGAGLDGFKTLYTNEYRLPQYQEEFQYPHNLLLTFWAETGIFGLIIFVLIVVRSLLILIKKIDIYSAALFAALTYWMIHGLVDVPYFKNDLSLEFFIIIALIQIWSTKKTSLENN